VTIQIKAIEQYFHVVLFIMLDKVVLTLTSEINPASDHSNVLQFSFLVHKISSSSSSSLLSSKSS